MKRHDTDAISLTFGLVFLAFVGWGLLVRWVSAEPPGFGWFAGAALIIVGLCGVLATLISWRGHRAVDPPAPDQVPQP
jgi:hypothetical protein